MRRLIPAASAVLSLLFLAGCATMAGGSYVARGVDFDRYRTYDWGPPDALPIGDARLDNNAVFQDHLQGEIEQQLAARGFERAAEGATPDLRIHYHASVERRLLIHEVDEAFGACPSFDCQPRVTEFEAGTLVLDFIDARANTLVWRGWAQDTLDGIIGSQERLERQVDAAVTIMFERLPVPLVRTESAARREGP
jgi:hypothetical protein